MAKLRPWTPWVTADHYKRKRSSTIRNNPLEPKNNLLQPQLQQKEQPSAKIETPSQKRRRRKDPFLVTPKHSPPNPHEKQSSPHDIHYTTNPFYILPNNQLHDTCFQGIILPLSHQIFLSHFLVYLSSFFLPCSCLFSGCSRLLSAVVFVDKSHYSRFVVLLTKRASIIADREGVHHQPSGKFTGLVWSFGLNNPSIQFQPTFNQSQGDTWHLVIFEHPHKLT